MEVTNTAAKHTAVSAWTTATTGAVAGDGERGEKRPRDLWLSDQTRRDRAKLYTMEKVKRVGGPLISTLNRTQFFGEK